jgi:N-acetylmuramoyl-L-alanine amidase
MHLSFLRKPHLLIPLAGLALAVTLSGDPQNRPAWWTDEGTRVIPPGAIENNKGPANIGQAKHMVAQALKALDITAPTLATQIRADLAGTAPNFTDRILDLAAPANPSEKEKQKAPLLLGQLKAIAAPFYSRLAASSPANATWLAAERTTNGTNYPNSIFPWTATTDDDSNRSIATIGQLKAVFSLRFESLPPPNLPPLNPDADTDGDGLTDGEEYLGGYVAGNRDSNNNGISDGYDDDDGDGYPNHIELKAGTDPRNPNSKPDGVSTDTLLVTNFSYTAKQRAASFAKTEFRAFVPTQVVNAKGLITSERYKFYNSRTIQQNLNQNSALIVTIAEDDTSQRTLKHDIIEKVFYNRSDTNEYFTGQLNNGSSEPGERSILKRVRSSDSEEGLFSKRSHDNGNTWGSDTDFSISGESVSDDLSFQKIKDEWTVKSTPFPDDGNGITYTNPARIPDSLTTPTSMYPDLLSQTSEASQTVETQTSFSRSAWANGGNSGFEEVSTTMKTTLKDEFTDDAMIGLVKDVFNTKPYGEPSWNIKLESKYSLSDETDGGRAFTLSDMRYRLSTYVGPNIKKIVFLWKEITEFDPAGMQDGSGAPLQTVQWKKETVINNSANSYQKIETAEYLLSHPEDEGKRFIQRTVASSFLAPDIVRVDHDTKPADEVPSNLYGINFSVPADLIGQNVTLTSVGQGVVQLWEKVSETYHKRPFPYTLQGEQKAGVGSSNGKFYIQGLVPGILSLKLNSPLVLIAEKGVTVVDLDVDVDSDNSGVIDHNATEEERESLEGESGKIIFNLSRSDADNDGVPNFADLDNAGRFTPITVKTDNIDPSGTIQFRYSASPPSEVFTTTASDGSINYFPARGLRVDTLMRIWTKDGDELRVLPDDFIKPERLYTLQELGMSPGSTKTFFVEAIHDSIGLAGIRVRASQGLEDRVMVNLLPVEVVELAPKLRDESDAEIVGSEKPAVAPKSTEMVERDPSATPTPLNDASAIRIAWRDMKVKIGAPMTGKKVTWSMAPQFTPLQSDGTPEAAPRFRGKWGTAANTVHRHRFSASEKYGVNGYESIAQILEPETSAYVTTVAQTTVDADGYTAIRVNLAPLGFNKALIKISIEDLEGEIDLIELEVPAVIVIDPGHGTGGFTGNSAEGSVGLHTNVTEGDAVLDIGTRALNEINRIKDERGLLVRKYSTKNSNDPRLNIGLNDREGKARQCGADTYVSLHFDGASTDPNSKPALYRNPFGMIDQDDTLWNRNPRADWALARRVRMAVQTAIAAVEPAESIQASETAYDEWNATHDPDAERLTSEINESRLQIGLGALNDGGNPGQQNGNYRAGDVRYTPCRATLIEMERTANKQADNLFNGNTAYNAATGEIILTALAESMRARVATEIAGACIDDALIRDLADQADVPVRTNKVPRLDFENE